MATITFKCPNCPAQGSADESYIGRRARCKQCGTPFNVTPIGSQPAPSPEAAPPADGVPAVWQVGDVVADLYEVQQVFTGGGMGLVYKVHHRNWNINLATKSPRPEFLRTEAQRQSFVTEAETWVNLGLHPHIVSCYYVRELGGIPRVFAEYVDGGSLYDWIESGKLYEGGHAAALERILDIAIQFAWGLHYAHEQGLVHQDVKPANVMMTLEGMAKVTDFGLAKARAGSDAANAGSAAPSRSILVSSGGMTPAYCSPEQAEHRPLTRKTDIWSWAVSVLHMFTGEITWSGGQIADSALEGYLAGGSEDESLPEVPRGLAAVLRHCLQVAVEERQSDLLQVAVTLQEVYKEVTGQSYVRELSQALELLSDTLNNHALSLLDLGQEAEALECWRKALARDAYHPESIYNHGLVLWRKSEQTDAQLLEQLDEAAKQSQRERWLIDYLNGLIHLERSDHQGAIAALQAAQQAAWQSSLQPQEVTQALATAEAPGDHWGYCFHTLSSDLEETSSVNKVTALNLNADGRYALSGQNYVGLRLWDMANGQCLRTFEGHTSDIIAARFCEDERYVLTAALDRTVKRWEVKNGRCLNTYPHENLSSLMLVGSNHVSLSRDGQRILYANGGKLILAEVTSGRSIHSFVSLEQQLANHVTAVTLSDDGLYALSSSQDRVIRLWDTRSGLHLRSFEGELGEISCLRLNRDGRWLLSGHWDGALRLWDVATGDCVRLFEGHNPGSVVATFSPGEEYVASGGGDNTVRLWDVSSGRCLRTYEGHTGAIKDICYSATGRHVLSGGFDAIARVWKTPDLTVLSRAPAVLSQVRASSEATSNQGSFRRMLEQAKHELQTGQRTAARQVLEQARALPGYQRHLEVLDLWAELGRKARRRGCQAVYLTQIIIDPDGSIAAASFGPDNARVLTGCHGGSMKLWEVKSGHCVRAFESFAGKLGHVCLSPDRRHAVSSYNDDYSGNPIRLWDVETGQCLRTFGSPTHGANSLCLSPDGEHVLTSSYYRTNDSASLYPYEHSLRLWKVHSGRCIRMLETPVPKAADASAEKPRTQVTRIGPACLSPDGLYAAVTCEIPYSADRPDKMALCDVNSAKCLRTYAGGSGHPRTVCFSPDQCKLLSCSIDRFATLHLWDVHRGNCVQTLEDPPGPGEPPNGAQCGCFSPDGRFILSGHVDSSMKLWDIETGQCLYTLKGHTGSVGSVSFSSDGRYALSTSSDGTARLWELEWDYDFPNLAPWDEGARPYLESFLTLHTPLLDILPSDRPATLEEVEMAPMVLTRTGEPNWNEKDFEQLLCALSCAGYGWLRPDGVRRELEAMAAQWQGPPTFNSGHPDGPVASSPPASPRTSLLSRWRRGS